MIKETVIEVTNYANSQGLCAFRVGATSLKLFALRNTTKKISRETA